MNKRSEKDMIAVFRHPKEGTAVIFCVKATGLKAWPWREAHFTSLQAFLAEVFRSKAAFLSGAGRGGQGEAVTRLGDTEAGWPATPGGGLVGREA